MNSWQITVVSYVRGMYKVLPYSLYICDKVIRIEEEHKGSFLRFCRGYIVKEPAPEPDYTIKVYQNEIDKFRQVPRSKCNAGISAFLEETEKLRSVANTKWDDQISGDLILKKLAVSLLQGERTLFIHGSVVAHKKSAFMFTAPSGIGKTTHSLLWTKYLQDAYILNGDKPFISTGEKIMAWGSPWCGSEQYNRNEGVELKAICILRRAEKNLLTEISADEAFPMLAKQTGDPDPSDYRTKIWLMEGLERLRGRVKFYLYEMNNLLEEEAFHTTYDVLSKL